MNFDPGLAQRIREALGDLPDIGERQMFGGLAFLRQGHMFVGVLGPALMARVGPEGYQEALAMKHVREMDFTGRPMRGYVFVDPPGYAADQALADWIARSLEFTSTLPPKSAKC